MSKKKLYEPFADPYRREFERTNDPYIPWEVWRIARHCNADPPDWVTEHLDRCADSVLATLYSKKDARASTLAAIAKGMGFTTEFVRRKARTRERHRTLGFLVWMIRQGERSDNEAFSAAAVKFTIEESTARRAYKEFRESGFRSRAPLSRKK